MKNIILIAAFTLLIIGNIIGQDKLLKKYYSDDSDSFCELSNANFSFVYIITKGYLYNFKLNNPLNKTDIRLIDSIFNIFTYRGDALTLKLADGGLKNMEIFHNSLDYLTKLINIKYLNIYCPKDFIISDYIFQFPNLERIWIVVDSTIDFSGINYLPKHLKEVFIVNDRNSIIKGIDRLSKCDTIDLLSIRTTISNIDEFLYGLRKVKYIKQLEYSLNYTENYSILPEEALLLNAESLSFDNVDLSEFNSKTVISDKVKSFGFSHFSNLKIPFWWYFAEWRNPPLKIYYGIDHGKVNVKKKKLHRKFLKKYLRVGLIDK